VIAPKDPDIELRGRKPVEAAAQCGLTTRGERLREVLQEKKAHWNEMAALRYRIRQGPIFKPLRMIARAYRPGGGLKELHLPRLIYELNSIYAPEMPLARLHSELRRIQCLGFLCPAAGAHGEAWYPEDWEDGAVVISPRGYAMLEGFRLEE
jgi:hypothetical protein